MTDWNDFYFSYNDNGEATSKTDTSTSDVTSYTWSPFGKLETVTLPNTDVVTYKYDGYGRKAQVLLNGTVQYALLYQGQLRPVAQMDSSGNLIARFIWGQKLNTPEYIVKSGVSYRLVTDPRGSVRLVLKADDGTVAQRLDYNEWGEVTNDTSPGFQPFGYAGGLYDHQTKLTEFGARHYDGHTGRFTSKDPILFNGGSMNLYSYTANDPINRIDPTGLDWIYNPRTGAIYQTDGNGNRIPGTGGDGYSGNGPGLNNPDLEGTPFVGPIPRGDYNLGAPRDSNTGRGPHTIPITPAPGNNAHGRNQFLIHGDNGRGDNSASQGCVILPRNVRERISNSGDNRLRVQ